MRAFVILAAGLVALFLACNGGDGNGATPSPQTPTPEVSPTLRPDVDMDAIEAMRTYLRDTGLDGKTGELADPFDCLQMEGDADFCIIDEASVYAPGVVILHVADADNPSEDVWQVHLNKMEGRWEVVDVEYFSPE